MWSALGLTTAHHWVLPILSSWGNRTYIPYSHNSDLQAPFRFFKKCFSFSLFV